MDREMLILYTEDPGEAPIYNLNGEVVGTIKLPLFFGAPVRKDVIRRAFLSALTARIQRQGRDPLAGKRRVGESWGIGYSVARVPRLDNGRAVIAPMTRGGRRAHPPRVEKNVYEDINKKEMKLAIISALAASAKIDFVKKRGHVIPENIQRTPVIVSDDLEKISRASEARDFLRKIGLWRDVERVMERIRIRAGKGKMRGRRYVEPKSFLLIISSPESPALKAFRNMSGVDVTWPGGLGIHHLAPGGEPGRLVIITQTALNMLSEKYMVKTL
ncbi:MAG: 50S ribosomal protein L4 [Desulfurococcales archaeon]|jgi:large subunit ribosomal protein L4e|nr:50S ribosomal protein L4 [Desulfurococcales archaeon]